MKLKSTFVIILLTLTSCALAMEPWEGTYIWNNESQQDRPGNVLKHVNLRLAIEEDQKIVLSCEVLWKPGMDADFGAVIEQSAVVDRTLEDGTVVKVIPFAFQDSNENIGTGEVEIHGVLATIHIVNTEIKFPEAARQYGTYEPLQRSP